MIRKYYSLENPFAAGYDTGAMFVPWKEKGQHILIDPTILSATRELIPPGEMCIEIGAGPGNLTRELLANDNRVEAFEIDHRCEPMLDELGSEGDLRIHWQSFLDASNEEINTLGDFHIVGNIPYHISEPLMFKLTKLGFKSAVLLIGSRLANSLTVTNPSYHNWTRMSLVANAFFDIEVHEEVPRTAFDPVPRADGALIRMTRKDRKSHWQSDALASSYRALVEADEHHSTVARALKQVYIHKDGRVHGGSGKNKKAGDYKVQRATVRIALREYTNDYNATRQTNSPIAVKAPHLPETMLSIVSPLVDKKILSRPLSGISNHQLKEICSVISDAINKRTKRQLHNEA